ncbi:peptide alpha-N-acetyltransferase Nat2 [Colletotrichum orchidophilum]|uniref:Peptide alpha-N-acetyltransferase Nat2 n=1 Tax=Colletotrichum orchidophilum TaxID=1209926 RepID=A0A1G4ANV6_9PEZI|nr:peptide alpha-N-acetyltransferase Nat2 [Colletotrichum orchidophilum]OHE90849.1 peptide alpha-N-acetyltransferase Nat2 [Colletotrichum orchidophilum]
MPHRAIPAARQNVTEALWRKQFSASTRTLKTAPSRALNQRPGAPQSQFRWSQSQGSSWFTSRLDTIFHSSRRTFRFSSRQSNSANGTAKESLSLSQRLKKLSREYGWSAVGVYLALSVLDFPFCFLLVRIVGTDRIGQLEHWVVSHVKKVIPDSVKNWWNEYRAALSKAESEQLGNDDISEAVEMATWGVEEAQRANKAEASLGTQLALAYAIHKSFIFLRVPLTAAVTPKVVKVLRSWGWQIGKRRSK